MAWLERLFRRGATASARTVPTAQLEAAIQAIDAGRIDEALALAALLEMDKANDLAAFVRARAALTTGDRDAHIAHLRQAAVAAPHEEAYCIELALALGDGGDAAGAAASLAPLLDNQATEAAHTAMLHFRLAGWRHATGESMLAKRSLERALALQPDFAEAAHNLAELQMQDGELEPARTTLERAAHTSRRSDLLFQRALMLPSAYESAAHIDAMRARFDADVAALTDFAGKPVAQPEAEIGRTAFSLAYQGRADRASLSALCVAMRRHYPAAATQAPQADDAAAPRRRVGLVCAYFRRHSVGRAFIRLIERLRADDLDIRLFAAGAPPADDPLSSRFRAAADHFVVLPADVAAAAAEISRHRLDLLVYPELGMDPFTWFLAHWRIAPVQCACAGHPDTTGIDTIDIFLSDATSEPTEAKTQYSERLVAVDGMFLPLDDLPEPAQPGGSTNGATRRYVCTQTLIKLHPDFDAMIAGILERDPKAEIAIFADPDARASDVVARRMRSALGSAGDRLKFIGRMDYAAYLGLVGDADVMLDTPHFGGGNTTLEALGLGVPVVTVPGRSLRGRFAYGRLLTAGMRECIAGDPAEYAERAVAVARDPSLNRRLREQLRAARSSLEADAPAERFAAALRNLLNLPPSGARPR